MAWLLDTHALIWLTDDPAQLSDAVRTCIDDAPDDVFVSVTTIWEIAIKRSIGKLDLPVNATELLEIARKNHTPILDIQGAHAAKVEDLPFHHRDPFDRLLAAQALSEDLTLISKDAIFDQYGVKRLW
jgi:PIN domain nuclease of toxin-antitoxin system